MLLMAVSGAAVLALVCWAALRESAPATESFLPQRDAEHQLGGLPDRGAQGEGERQRAGGWGAGGEGERQRAGGLGGTVLHDSHNGAGGPRPGALGDATVADADTAEALAAAAALWRVLAQKGS